MGVTYGVDETVLPDSNNGTSDGIVIPINFPFGNFNQTQFYVICMAHTLWPITC